MKQRKQNHFVHVSKMAKSVQETIGRLKTKHLLAMASI